MFIAELIISMLLFFVLFYGISFLVNMLLRMSWIVAIIYPVIVVLFVDKVRFIEYFRNSSEAFSQLGERFVSLGMADVLILSSGLVGTVAAGITIKLLRKNGYQMF